MLQVLNEVKTEKAPGPTEVSLKLIAASGDRNSCDACNMSESL